MYRLPAKFGTPVRRAARWGRLWGCARQSDAQHRIAVLGRHRRQCRRAERHGYHSLTARQSRDLLLISGRVDYVTTPAPLASPPKHPPKKVFRFLGTARARGSSCGSFLPSLCSVRRSPSAPRKCHSPLSLWAESASAENPISLRVDGQPLTLPSLTRRDCPSSLFPELQIPQAPTKNSLHDSKKFAFSADTNPKAKM